MINLAKKIYVIAILIFTVSCSQLKTDNNTKRAIASLDVAYRSFYLCSARCLYSSEHTRKRSLSIYAEIAPTKQEAKDKIYSKCTSSESYPGLIVIGETLDKNGKSEFVTADAIQDSQCSEASIIDLH